MIKKYIKISLVIWLFSVIILPQLVSAANPALDKLTNVAATNGPYAEGTNEFTASEIIGVVITTLLSLLGVIFLGLMIYAGFMWMNARGEEEKVTKARDTLNQAIVGIIIVVASYAIWDFVFYSLILK